jgi:hypothetical protein
MPVSLFSGRRLSDRMAATQHIESHIRDDHSADDPEHVQRNAKYAQDLETDQRRTHQYDQDVEGGLGGRASPFRYGQVRRQGQKERTAYDGIDDGQNGYNRLQNLVKVRHEIDSQAPKAFTSACQ